ncbi:MAG: YtxH domain-containing protein [Bacteroidota bacterium]
MSGTKVILGLIAGASIGAIAGILFAPEKGSDTRRRIADKTVDLGNSVKDCLTDMIKGNQNTEDAVTDNSSAGMRLNTIG